MAVENFAKAAEMRTLASVILERYRFARQAGLTFNDARDLYAALGYAREITIKDYRDRYARGGVAKRIVEAYPKATWRGGVELMEDENPKVTTKFEETWEELEKRLKIWSVLFRADVLAGLSTYSVILIGAPGDFSQELPKGKPEQLLYLTPFCGGGGPAITGESSLYVDATIQTFETNANSPRFGLPTTYQLRRMDVHSPELQKPVHWSRIIHIAEGCLDNDVYGVPVLENIWNLLDDLEKVTGGGAEAFWLRANQGLNLNLDKDVELTPEAASKLTAEVDEYRHNISRILKTRGMEVQTLGSDVANFSNPADAILTQIAGSKGIPKRILMGSEMGQLASGQDADNWATQVQDRRTGYAAPSIVQPLVDRLIDYGYLPKPKQYEVVWPVIESLTELERAQGASSWASTNSTQGSIVFLPEEIRDHWYGLEPLTPEQIAKATPQPTVDPNAAPAPGVEGAPVEEEATAEGVVDELLAEEPRAAGGEGSGVRGHTTPGEETGGAGGGAAAAPARQYKVVRSPQGVEAKVARRSIKEAQKFAEDAAKKLQAKGFKMAKQKATDAAKKLSKEGFKLKGREFVHADGRRATISIGKDFTVTLNVSKATAVKEPEAPKKTARKMTKEEQIRKATRPRAAEEAAGNDDDEEYSYSSVQIPLPDRIAGMMAEFAAEIPEEDLASDEGIEDDAHVTVKYGLHTDDAADVSDVLDDFDTTIELELGETRCFEGDEYDVLYVEVNSPTLAQLNEHISQSLEVTDTHDEYVPHATIAYLQPGAGAKYVGDQRFVGEKTSVRSLVFSPAEGEDTSVELRTAADIEMLRVLTAAIEAGNAEVIAELIGLGGPGSGNFGHAGRPGEVGGSAPDGEGAAQDTKATPEVSTPEVSAKATRGAARLIKQLGPMRAHVQKVFADRDEFNGMREAIDQYLTAAGYEKTMDKKISLSDSIREYTSGSSKVKVDTRSRRVKFNPNVSSLLNNRSEFVLSVERVGELVGLGGPGSGNFGHAGRPGKIGGSAPSRLDELNDIIKRPVSDYPPAKTGDTMLDLGPKMPKTTEDSNDDLLWQHDHPPGLDTLQIHTQPDGTLTPERKALHDAIVEKILNSAPPPAKGWMEHHPPEGQPTCFFMGGGGAAGKSSMQSQLELPADRVHIDVDIIRTMLPEWEQELNAAAAEGRIPNAFLGTFTHEESSLISKRILDAAAQRGLNLTADGAGDSSIEKVEANVERYSAGGQRVVANYVTVDYDLAYARMRARGDKIDEETGRQYGRYIPARHLRAVHAQVARVFPEAVKRGLFDEFTLWDTTDAKPIGNGKFSPPVRVASGKGSEITIHDQAAWERFLARGKGIAPRPGEI